MAELNKSDFESKYNHVSTGLYKTNSSNAIGSDDLRAQITDLRESVLWGLDDRYTLFKQFTTTTSTTAYVGTTNPAITAYADGQVFQVKAHATSTGSATLNLNVLGAKKWYTDPTTQVGAGDIVINQIYIVAYDSALDSATGGFLMIGSGGVSQPAGSDTQFQFNDSGVMGGDAGATFNKTTNVATFGGVVVSDLTSGRIPYTTTNGRLVDTSKLGYNGSFFVGFDGNGISGDATISSQNSFLIGEISSSVYTQPLSGIGQAGTASYSDGVKLYNQFLLANLTVPYFTALVFDPEYFESSGTYYTSGGNWFIDTKSGSAGLQYAADHSVYYTSRSLADWGSIRGAKTFTGMQTFAAPGTTAASFLLPVSAAPGTPVDGMVWREDNTNTGLKIRINGVTKTITVS